MKKGGVIYMMMVVMVMMMSAVVMADSGGRKYINPGVMSPCHGPNPPPGCYPENMKRQKPEPIHKYRRGCHKHHRCRG
ncbi:PREDICTED: protein RALF-like 26 [Tarenaya hassleriana]|uniref:protein RALF-like 26 n=1 Tax=Tarenaya hassleriana TaxID=28532 RepID=UPI0008FD1476|nr:PREDICTED: protein RALF-like 26 [Tarenaya hassleriana]